MDKQLIIIGNGFDLYCGLKSRYSDFYKAKIEGKFKREMPQPPYCSSVQTTSSLLYYINRFSIKNFWHTLLNYYYNSHDNLGWCDIEGIIKKTLYIINEEEIIDDAWFECYKFYRNNSVESIASIIEEDSSLAFIKEYCFCYFYKNYVQGIFKMRDEVCNLQDKEIFYKHLFEELNSLEKLFCEYLKEQTKKIDKTYRINATNLLIKLTDTDLKLIKALCTINQKPEYDFRNINILSFNYTTPFVHKHRLGNYNHVHGKLCEKDCQECSSSTVIFGIDDKVVKPNEKVDNLNEYEDFRFFSKTYRTLFLDANKISALPKNDNSPLTIKFFGHSLNEADYSYFQSIFDYYSIYDNSNVSLVFYYTPYKSEAKQEVADSVYKLINQYGATFSNEDQGQNLMHKLILEKRVKIKEV